MSSPFMQTSRALDRDNFQAAKILAFFAIAILFVWLLWFVRGSVTLRETAPARVAFISDPFPIIVPRDGKVISHKLILNRQIDANEVLLELDSFQAQMANEAAQAGLERLQAERKQLNQELESAKKLKSQFATRSELEQQEALLAQQQQQTRLTFLNDQLSRTEKLYKEGKIAELTYLQERSERDEAQQQASLLGVTLQRLKAQNIEREQELERDILRINSALETNRGNLAETEKRIAQLEHEREQYLVRAPQAGILAEVTPLSVGTQVREGQPLGQLLSAEKHIVRAAFTPAAAIGKLKTGHRATMRLDGFPWLQYGEIELQITHVANESRNGRIRVDFEVTATPKAIELRHGLPGQVIVETEQLQPIAMLLRTLGSFIPSESTTPGEQP